jgi:hypothetical protein
MKLIKMLLVLLPVRRIWKLRKHPDVSAPGHEKSMNAASLSNQPGMCAPEGNATIQDRCHSNSR